MKFKASFIPFFLLFILIQPPEGLTQEKGFVTLEAGISEALANNWSFKAKKEKIEQAVNVKKQAKAEFFPKLSMTYGYTRLNEPMAFRSPSFGGEEIEIMPEDNYQWRGSVTQPLFTGFALTSSFKLAKLGIDLSEMELELEKLDLALHVKQSYFNILETDKALDVAKKAVESLTSHVDTARSFYDVGMIPVNDLLKSEVELAAAERNLVNARNFTLLARSAFNIIMGRSVNSPVEVEDILVYVPEQGDFEVYVQKAIKDRPEMKAIAINILQAGQEIRLAKSEYYPEIALQYDYIKEGDDLDVSGSEFHDANRWEAMAMCSWTFWEWGKTHYTVRQKQGLQEELNKTRMAIKDNIRLELKEAVLALDSAEKNIPTTRKAVEQGEENLRVSQERYKAQVATSTEVLDAQTLLTEARMDYYTALYVHNMARAHLQRALGTY